ncbi:hypothetical protein [Sandaracinus amylolyticus]|uniref:hypothetical protein n=1 Tax=Sandaracinus amylolyticus TaxID=927083 RepID=UPI001F3BE25C|nr:hypothetical protein [Sandaracinus amylolyticus]UJR83988.1 Hypothetical protein I5071_60590 [Sandaracinus amylolyticus]
MRNRIVTFVIATMVFVIAAPALAQDDAGTEDAGAVEDGGAPSDAGVDDAAVDAFIGPVDGSRPEYPLLRDEGGYAWVCTVGFGRRSDGLTLSSVAVAIAILARRRRR